MLHSRRPTLLIALVIALLMFSSLSPSAAQGPDGKPPLPTALTGIRNQQTVEGSKALTQRLGIHTGPRFSNSDMPATIRVAITGYIDGNAWAAAGFPVQRIAVVNFKDYVKNVLPNEWYSGWHVNALKAGAMAVKMFAWWRTNYPRSGGYDVVDNTYDQVYVNGSAVTSTSSAVEETWPYAMRDNGIVTEIHYVDTDAHCASWLPGTRCMGQYNSRDWANAGNDWQWILHHYYDPVVLETLNAPANDTYAGATVIGSLPFNADQVVVNATAESTDPDQSCIGDGNPRHFTRSVWYRYTPSASGKIHVEVQGGTDQYDSVLTAYTGSAPSFTLAACNDDITPSTVYQSAFDLDVLAGTTYHLMVTQWTDGTYYPVNPRLYLSVTQLSVQRPDTVGIYRPSNSRFYLRNTNSTGPADIDAVMGSGATDQPVVGDWDGDGVDTIGVYRNGVFYLKNANTTAAAVAYQFTLGNPGDLPMAGDWDNDGKDGVGTFRPTNGRLYLRNGLSTGFADFAMVLGISGDRPVAGDWNGDGFDSPGVYRPSNSRFYLTNQRCNCTVTADHELQLGNVGDVGFAGDWNSDGKDSVGVFRPTNGVTYLRDALTTGFADVSMIYGIANDKPVAGKWIAAGAAPQQAPEFVPGR